MTWRAGFATRVLGTSTTFTEFHSLGYFSDFAAGVEFAVFHTTKGQISVKHFVNLRAVANIERFAIITHHGTASDYIYTYDPNTAVILQEKVDGAVIVYDSYVLLRILSLRIEMDSPLIIMHH